MLKKMMIGAAALGLAALAPQARADDDNTVKHEETTKKDSDGSMKHKSKTEKKTDHNGHKAKTKTETETKTDADKDHHTSNDLNERNTTTSDQAGGAQRDYKDRPAASARDRDNRDDQETYTRLNQGRANDGAKSHAKTASKTESKSDTTVEKKEDGHTVTDTTKEMKHDGKGSDHDKDTKTKTHVETDASGNVVDKKVETK